MMRMMKQAPGLLKMIERLKVTSNPHAIKNI